jgi:hypothetical protein
MGLSDLAQGLLLLVAALAYVMRQEGRLNQVDKSLIRTQKDVDELRVLHNSLDSKTFEKLLNVEKALARIEGALSARHSKQGD